eukprot:gene10841-3461_t
MSTKQTYSTQKTLLTETPAPPTQPQPEVTDAPVTSGVTIESVATSAPTESLIPVAPTESLIPIAPETTGSLGTKSPNVALTNVYGLSEFSDVPEDFSFSEEFSKKHLIFAVSKLTTGDLQKIVKDRIIAARDDSGEQVVFVKMASEKILGLNDSGMLHGLANSNNSEEFLAYDELRFSIDQLLDDCGRDFDFLKNKYGFMKNLTESERKSFRVAFKDHFKCFGAGKEDMMEKTMPEISNSIISALDYAQDFEGDAKNFVVVFSDLLEHTKNPHFGEHVLLGLTKEAKFNKISLKFVDLYKTRHSTLINAWDVSVGFALFLYMTNTVYCQSLKHRKAVWGF